MTPLNSVGTKDWLEVTKDSFISELVVSNSACAVFEQPVLGDNQITPTGMEIPIPMTDQFFEVLNKASRVIPGTTKSRADVIADAIDAAVDNAGTTPDNSPKPSHKTVTNIIGLIGVVTPMSLLGEPDVDTLNGEINLTWNDRAKQIILICRSNQEPLVHHHQHIKGKPSKHGIEKATAKSLAKWLRWLHE